MRLPEDSEKSKLFDGMEVVLPEPAKFDVFAEMEAVDPFEGLLTEEARTMLEPEPQLLMEAGYRAPDATAKLWRGINRMFDLSPPEIYNTLSVSADQAEQEGGFAGRYVAQHMRRAAGQAAAAKLGWQLLDIEERPRKMAINLAYVMKMNEVDPGTFPAKTPLERWELYKKAIVDGFNGEEYVSAWTAGHLMLPGVTEEHLKSYHAFMDRHPVLKLMDKADQVGVNLATAVITETAMGFGLKKGATFAADFFKEVSDKVLHRGFREAVETSAVKLVRDEAWRVKPKVDPAHMTAALGGEAGEHVDDVLKTALTKQYLKEVKKRKVVPPGTIDKLTEVISFGKAKSIDDLTEAQLRSLMDDLETIMLTPKELGRGAQALTRIGDVGGIPSWKVFEHYKIPRAYDIMDDALYQIQVEQIARSQWVDDVVKKFDKTYETKWDDFTDELAARFADEGPDAKIPDELRARFTEGQVDHIKRIVAEDREKFWEPLADLAEKQGKIGISEEQAKQVDVLTKRVTKMEERTNVLLDEIDELTIKRERVSDEVEDKMVLWRDATTEEVEEAAMSEARELRKRGKALTDKSEEKRALVESLDERVDKAKEQVATIESAAVSREEFYYHHRTRIHRFMKERAASKKESLSILPADYRMGKLTKRKIPVKVNVPEFFARTLSEEDISYAWRDVTGVAHREELRKLFMEPAAEEMDTIIKALPTDIRNRAGAYASEWMRYVRSMPSVWDERLNWFFNQASRGIEAVSRGRWQAQGRAFENLARRTRGLIYAGTIGGNPRAIAKNLTQSLLTVNTIGSRATLAGIESAYTEGGRRMLNQYRVMVGRNVWRGGLSLGEFNITNPKGWQKLLNSGFAGVDRYINCIGAGNGLMWRAFRKNKRYMDELIEYGAKKGIRADDVAGIKFWSVLADSVEDGHFKHLVDMANKNIKLTQYSYRSWDMPKHLWSQTGKAGWMFTTWPSNYFGAHIPQLFGQLVRGENVMGQAVTTAERLALFTHVARGLVLFETGRRLGYNMTHLLPTGPTPAGRVHGYMKVPVPITPPAEVAIAVGSFLVGGLKGDETLIKEGWNGLANVAPSFVPAGTGIRHTYRWLSGEQPASAMFFPLVKKKKPPARRKPMTIEEKLRRQLKRGLPILP